MKLPENEITAELAKIFSSTYNSETLIGIGDDCAVLKTSGLVSTDQRFVTSTDILVEDVHFKFRWSTPEQVAKRAFAQNFADIAAMGARGTSALVALSVPKNLPESWLFSFAQGFANAALEQKVAVVGGDLTRGEKITISITAFGALDGRSPVTRFKARPGDSVAIAGELGLSALGFDLISHSVGEKNPKAVRRYLTPEPPYAAGIAASKAGASSMIDISDGLVIDLSRVAKASGVSFRIQPTQNQKGSVSDSFYYFGGEDHCLVATFPPAVSIPPEFYIIGNAVEQTESLIICSDLAGLENIKSWDHFDQ